MTRENLLLNGRYRLADQLAAGGMGEVWKSVDELLGRHVAVKLLHHQYVDDPTFRARFRAEARYTAQLTHPGIAQVYDYGEQDDIAFLVMELVPGEPLSEILARHHRLNGDVTLDIVGQAARALQSAHDAGLMHRDIKPGNLLVIRDGTVKLTDFGIARAAEAATLTQTGTVMGTAQYVSPEQAAGKALTPATDIYSLGVVAYECLAGGPPFTAETAVTVALKHVRESPPPLPRDIPEPVQELVALALEKDPAGRPRSASEFADRAHIVRETLAFGAAQTVTGESTLSRLLAAGPDDATATGATAELSADAPKSQTPAPGQKAATPAVGMGQPPYEAAYDEANEEPPRRRRRGPVLALAAVVVLISALLVGALWRGGGDGDEQEARQVQTTPTPTFGAVVPPDDSAAPSPTPANTFEEQSQSNVPGGNISPRRTPTEEPPGASESPSPSESDSPTPTETPGTDPSGGEETPEED